MGRSQRPLNPHDGPVEAFAVALRTLRSGAGNPTYRAMAQRAGYAVTTLSQAAAGERLPSLPVTLAYVRACKADPVEWEARGHAAETATREARRTPEGAEDDAPYRGLARFEVSDAAVFFGRDTLTQRLAELAAEHRFIAVFGPSGSGKSSLLRAGLVPRLRAGEGFGAPVAAVRILTPGAHPLATHAQHLEPAADEGDTWILVDQFEELYTLCEDPAERAAFLDKLLTARAPQHRLRVVITVRADFLDQCTAHPELTAAMQDATALVGPMSDAELREAITKPARSRGLVVQRSLTDRILREVQGEPGGLPLMSHALLETWRHRKGAALNESAYELAGGLHGAIARTAEGAYAAFTSAQAALARQILLRMVAPGRGTAATRRPIDRTELDFDAHQDAEAVLERLAAARLLVIAGDTVELAHEALITAWPRLRRWVEAERERMRLHRRLTEAARAWQDLDQEPGSLYRGSRLAAATEAFPAGTQRELTSLERTFLATSVRYRRRALRRSRSVIAGLAVLALLATGAAVIAVQQRGTARSERDTAVFHQLTAEADAVRGTQTSLAAQLDVTAYRRRPSAELYTRLLGDAHGPLSAPLFGHTDFVRALAYRPDGRLLASASEDRTIRLWDTADPGHARALGRPTVTHGERGPRSLAFSPDGRLLASGGHDNTVRLWDVSDPARITPVGPVLTGHQDGVISLAFSPDGKVLASGSDDETVRRWDVSRPAAARPLGRPLVADTADGVRAVAFSPDGKTLATTGFDQRIRLWNVTDPARPTLRGRPLEGHQEPVWSLAFSPDGHTLASAGYDRTVRLWDVTDPQRPRRRGEPLTGHEDAIWAVAFSPDGETLASAGLDDTVRLWYVKNPDYPKSLGEPLTDHTDGVWAVAFSSDGRTLASAGRDQAVRLWRRPDTLLTGHTEPVNAVAFHPEGRLLASAGNGGAVRLWDTSNPARPRRLPTLAGRDPVAALTFSPDGRLLAAAGEGGAVRLWRVVGPNRVRPVTGPPVEHGADVAAVAFSPDGRTLASAGEDEAIRLWDLSDPDRPRALGRPLTGHTNKVVALAFSPDGRTVASGAEDNTAWLWDVSRPTRGHRLAELRVDFDGFVTAVAFSPDGRTVATGGVDRKIRLWNVTDPARPTPYGPPLTGHRDPVRALAFRPDGQQLASGSGDDTVRLWDTRDPAAARPLGDPVRGHYDVVTSLAYHPDGTALATGSYDARTRVWLLPVDQAVARTCAATRGTLTRAEWRRHVEQVPYQPPCR
ncbi:WD40 repeat domain-containing protein [Streptomyces sp. HSW2009]|uniref:nSTAND1 domain-containing NTPase n=1 Tax=Streptomyces sp. HSW2009 TaxID=3142890 RepID=UPI0032F03011